MPISTSFRPMCQRARNAIIRNSLKDGIYGLAGAGLDLAHSTLSNNAGYMVQVNNGSVDMTLAEPGRQRQWHKRRRDRLCECCR